MHAMQTLRRPVTPAILAVPTIRLSGLTVLGVAALTVLFVGLLTNRMTPEWDMKYYLDMATNGIVGNPGLAAPFAYRPAAPLLIGGIAKLLHFSPVATFQAFAALMSGAFIVACYSFARAIGARQQTALFSGVVLALYFYVVKWTLFAGTMVDIYAYPLILLAFWALLRHRFYACLLISAVALFFKEFALLPLLTQAAVLVLTEWRGGWRRLVKPLGLTALVLMGCFLTPRLLIHVGRTFQDIDPINARSSLIRLLSYPASMRRDFNIVFAYISCWLPVLLLLDTARLRAMWTRLRPYASVLAVYSVFHFALVMYGGTNLEIFVTYSLPVQLLVLTALIEEGRVQWWEKLLVILCVILFNRIWMNIPSPQNGVDTYLNFYGGYHTLVTARSFARMAELFTLIAGFRFVRFAAAELSMTRRAKTLARGELEAAWSPR